MNDRLGSVAGRRLVSARVHGTSVTPSAPSPSATVSTPASASATAATPVSQP